MFYFHLRDSKTLRDSFGTDLPDLDAAREHAEGVARELTYKNTERLEKDWAQWTMSVQNEKGDELHSFPLSQFTEQDD